VERGSEPISSAWLAGLGVIVAVGATVAVLGLIFSDSGDDAARIAYLASLAAAMIAALLLPVLARRRQVEITSLRGDAAVLVFCLRAQATELAGSSRWPRERLAAALRTATAQAFRARRLTEILTRAGIAQEAIELRVALEALETSLNVGDPSAGRGGRA
jgi:hypothetical protein